MNNRNLNDNILLVIKGLAMGVANKIPGVSGGIVAIVTGFYEEFIYSLQRLNFKSLILLANGRFRNFIIYINGKFLGLISLGVIISYFTVSVVLDYALLYYERYIWALFFGMIVYSCVLLFRDFGQWKHQYITYSVLGFSIGLILSILDPANENQNLWFVFLCGFVSITGMTLPGLSGSFLLILMGNYVLLMVDAINAVGWSVIDLIYWNWERILSPERLNLLTIFGVFIIGSLTGLVVLSNLLHWALKHYGKRLNAAIIGFVLGSLLVLWPWHIEAPENAQGFVQNHIFTIICIVLGISIVVILDIYEKRRKS